MSSRVLGLLDGWQAAPTAVLVRAHAAPRPMDVTETQDAALARLMVSAQAGDQRVYGALLRSCVPLAAATIRRTGVAADRVDDAVQDVLLTIHRARASYDPARPFLPWLRAIAQRRAIDAMRLYGRTGARELADEDAYLNHASGAKAADEALIAADDAKRLRQAVGTLPPGQKQAIDLIGLSERCLDEAAGTTGRTKGALKVNFHRALAALRQRLGDGGDV